MKRLVLMRHAKSDWTFAEPDHARVLNPRGIRSARALGAWLRAHGIQPDAAAVSTATRTRESWGLLGLDTPATFVTTLYDASADTMQGVLRAQTGATVLMLGHNPGICALAHELVAEPPAHDRFDDYPTGATLVLRFDIAEWDALARQTGRVEDFVTPRDLMADA